MKYRSECRCECHEDNGMSIFHVAACCQSDPDPIPQLSDGPEYHQDLAAWKIRNKKCDKHDYRYVDDEYGSLASGGSYEVYECVICGKKSYSELPD